MDTFRYADDGRIQLRAHNNEWVHLVDPSIDDRYTDDLSGMVLFTGDGLQESFIIENLPVGLGVVAKLEIRVIETRCES